MSCICGYLHFTRDLQYEFFICRNIFYNSPFIKYYFTIISLYTTFFLSEIVSSLFRLNSVSHEILSILEVCVFIVPLAISDFVVLLEDLLESSNNLGR